MFWSFQIQNQLTIDSDGDGVMDRADNIIDPNDMTFIGNPHPDLTGGLILTLAMGISGLNMFFYGSYEMISSTTQQMDSYGSSMAVKQDAFINHGQPASRK